MSTGAVLMMVLSILVLWGGLALALLNLSRRSPTVPGEDQEGRAEVRRDR